MGESSGTDTTELQRDLENEFARDVRPAAGSFDTTITGDPSTAALPAAPDGNSSLSSVASISERATAVFGEVAPDNASTMHNQFMAVVSQAASTDGVVNDLSKTLKLRMLSGDSVVAIDNLLVENGITSAETKQNVVTRILGM